MRAAALIAIVAVAAAGASCRRVVRDSAEGSPPFPSISLAQSGDVVDCYGVVEVVLTVDRPTTANPFTEVFVSAEFGRVDAAERIRVDGFSDSPDGRTYRVRFMPAAAGRYEYSVKYWQDDRERRFAGTFVAVKGTRRGLLARDAEHPWHFVWAGTAEHYFLNGTTAYLLMAWTDEAVIRTALDRLHGLSVNRVRVLLDGRMDDFVTEPVKPGGSFVPALNPWVSRRPDDIRNPGFDYSRFNTPYWQKFERMLAYARDRDIVVSVIFWWNDSRVHPAAGSDDERRYIRYATARLAAYSNVTWDLGDDLDSFRSEAWTHATGTFLAAIDPYHHLATSHPVDNAHQDRTSDWFGMTSFQRWERPLHAWMLMQRQLQLATGRIIPQVNEEYGYEDHYPRWAPYAPPAASADANRRAAWDIVMAGGYQTTGETAKRGTGVAPDSGGGWLNGRGDATMTMLRGYARIVEFFASVEWWKTEPHDELVSGGAFCLAQPGETYVVYLPHGGSTTVSLMPGRYRARSFNPRTGEYAAIGDVDGPRWTSPSTIDANDWVLSIVRRDAAISP